MGNRGIGVPGPPKTMSGGGKLDLTARLDLEVKQKATDSVSVASACVDPSCLTSRMRLAKVPV